MVVQHLSATSFNARPHGCRLDRSSGSSAAAAAAAAAAACHCGAVGSQLASSFSVGFSGDGAYRQLGADFVEVGKL